MLKFENKDPSNFVVIYHANCSDGFGAAWSAWKALGNNATYIAGSYNDTTQPDVKDKHVVILDFSYPRDVLIEMHKTAKSLIILDHHKTAFDLIGDLEFTKFDMNKSGAMLAWEYFHEGKPAPKFIEYIQDNDLWKFKLPNSKEFSTVFYSVPFKFEEYDEFLKQSKIDRTIMNGSHVLSYQKNEINKIVKNALQCTFESYPALVVNSSVWQSEVGNVLSSLCNGVGIVWHHDYTSNSIKVSLRTARKDIDVGKIAAKLKSEGKTYLNSGGGHAGASGFYLSIDESILSLVDYEGKQQ